MDGLDLRLAVVDAVHARAHRERVEQAILVSVHPSRADDRRLGERFAHGLLAFELGAVEGRLGVGVGVEVGDVDEARDAGEVGDAGHATGAGDVHVVEGEVPGGGEI